jgi:hypothetical protein
MSGWRDALDLQLGTEKFWNSPQGRKYGDGFLYDMIVRRKDFAGATERDQGGYQHNLDLPSLMWRICRAAEPVWVDGGMMDVWEAAAESFPGEPLMPEDLLVPAGFAVFPRPFYVRDRNNKRLSTRAIAWAGILLSTPGAGERPGIVFALYAHRDDEDDFSDELREMHEQADELGLDRSRLLAATELQLVHWSAVPFGEGMPDNLAGTEQDWFRWVQALWRLMGQTLATTERTRLPRAWARRAQREDRDPYVTVIRLRRPRHKTDDDHEPASVDWAHRWIVGGHWRNQFYASTDTHRQIWISPYVKGPDDKPLRIRKGRAFELVQ